MSRMGIGRLSLVGVCLAVAACGSKETPSDSSSSGGSGGASGSPSGGASQGGTGQGGTGQSGSSGSGQGGSGASTTGGSSTGGEAGESGSSGASGSGGTDPDGGTGGAGSGAGGTAGASGGAGGSTSGGAGTGGKSGGVPTFMTRTLAMDHVAEGADAADIDGDGVIDLVAGPRWYKGPGFELGGTVMANPPTFTRDQYSTFFLTFADDVNGDGRPDVIAIGDAGGGNGSGTPNAYWYQNPGAGNFTQAWTKTAVYGSLVSNESPNYVNLLGDAKKELVFMTNNTAGYARPGSSATAAWTYTSVAMASFGTPYVHGLGVGDIDGDGLNDIVERTGWWRQTSAAMWERHAFEFWSGSTSGRPSNWGGAQMPIFDVDGDGDADVVSTLAAHRYGISWFERTGTGASITFTAHAITPAMAGMDAFSQAHSMVATDVNGDGLTDLIAGKRYYAHPSTNADPGTTEPPVIYWFELERSGTTATFVPHLIHSDSGAGCNFIARDLTGDGKVDIFTTNKRGTFLHVQQ